MKLLSVEGSNIGLLKGPFKLNFNGSLTAITGPIGVGKSTLLTMIKASLTNSVPGSGASWVSWGSGKDEPSYFKSVWSLDNKVIEIVKPMVDSAAFKALDMPRIRVTDFEDNVLFESFTSSGTAEILQSILPVTAKVIDTHLVVDQDSIAHPTTATPAKFQETLHTLTRVNEIEKVRVKLRESLSSYAVPEVSELLDTVTKDVTEIESDLAQKEQERDAVNSKLYAVDPQQLEEKIIKAEESLKAKEKTSKLNIDIANTKNFINQVSTEEARLNSELHEVDQTLSSLEDQLEKDVRYVSSYSQLKTIWDKQQKVIIEIIDLKESLDTAVPPTPVQGEAPNNETLVALQREKIKLDVEFGTITTSIEVCSTGVCPTCLQSTEAVDIDVLQTKQQGLQEVLSDLSNIIEMAGDQVDLHRDYGKALKDFEYSRDLISAEISSRQSAVNGSMDPVTELEFDEAEARIKNPLLT